MLGIFQSCLRRWQRLYSRVLNCPHQKTGQAPLVFNHAVKSKTGLPFKAARQWENPKVARCASRSGFLWFPFGGFQASRLLLGHRDSLGSRGHILPETRITGSTEKRVPSACRGHSRQHPIEPMCPLQAGRSNGSNASAEVPWRYGQPGAPVALQRGCKRCTFLAGPLFQRGGGGLGGAQI